MGLLDRFRKKPTSVFVGWSVKDIVRHDRIEKVTMDGYPNICVSALRHFEEHTGLEMMGHPYAPDIGDEDAFKVYFFPTFCVAEFNARTEEAMFVVFAPDQESPRVARMIVEGIAAVALEDATHEANVLADAGDLLQANLPPEILG